MIYLVDLIKNFNGKCRPLSSQYKDSDGNHKVPTNITITEYKDKLVSNIRLTDYMYVPVSSSSQIQYIPTHKNKDYTKSINIIHPTFEVAIPKVYEVEGDSSLTLNGRLTYKGLEDVRLVVWNGILYGIGFRPDVIKNKVIPQLIEFNDDFSINRTWFINTNKGMEKNWQPVEDRPFTFMYNPNTSETITLPMDELQESDNPDIPSVINDIETPEYGGGISGSSQLIRMRNGMYLSICHTSHRYYEANSYMQWVYNHYFVMYDENLKQVWMSNPFRFVADCMEFCCGMCIHDDSVCIAFSMFDGAVNILSVSYDKFDAMISEMKNNPDKYEDGTPAYDYMFDNINSESIVGLDIIPYAFFLEIIGKLDDANILVRALDMTDTPNYIKRSIYSYFIVRRNDTEMLIKKFNDCL